MRELFELGKRVVTRVGNHRLGLVSAGMAFYAILSIFPALTAIFSIYALIADPASLAKQTAVLPVDLPSALSDMIKKVLTDVTQGSGVALTLGLIASILIAAYAASKSIRGLVAALNIAYGLPDERGLLWIYLHSIVLTFGAVLLSIALLALIGLSGYLEVLDFGYWATELIAWFRWLVVLALMATALGVVYTIAPTRRPPAPRWLAPGAVLATVVWLLASLGFSFYIANFGTYNKIYGSIAAIMILLVWLGLSAFVFLIGAELNAELEETAARTPGASGPLDAIRRRMRAARG